MTDHVAKLTDAIEAQVSEPKRYPSGSMTYPGDCTDTIVRQMMGPTSYGTYMICESAEYDSLRNETRAHFVHALPDDINNTDRGGEPVAFLGKGVLTGGHGIYRHTGEL